VLTRGAVVLGGTVTKDAVNGQATFDNLVLFGGSGRGSKGLVLIASSGTASATSNTFKVKPGADHLFIAPLSTTVAGDNLGPVTVQVLDAGGALTPSDSTTQVQLYIDHNPGGARFIDANGKPVTGPLTATVNQGVATFADVRLDKAGVGYTLGVQPVNNALLPRATSNAFVVTAAQASGLAFAIQPTYTGTTNKINGYGTSIYHTWTGVTAQVVDRFGNPVAGSFTGGTATISAFDGNGNHVDFTSGTTAKNIDPATGVAAFDDLQISAAGANYTLQVKGSVQVNGQTVPLNPSTPSTPFNVGPARAGLAYVQGFAPPADAQVGATMGPIKVAVVSNTSQTVVAPDSPNIIKDDSTDNIYLNGGDFLGTKTVTVQDGVATFDDIEINLRGLGTAPAIFSYADLPLPTTVPQDIHLLPGNPYTLAFANTKVHTATTSPGTATAGEFLQDGTNNDLTVQLVDRAGNTIGNTRQTQTSSTTLGSNVISVQDTSRLSVGMVVQGPGVPGMPGVPVPSYTTITCIVSKTQIKVSSPATATASGVTLTFDPNAVISLGILKTEGRGPVFIGSTTDEAKAGDPAGLHSDVEVLAVNGVARFQHVYVNYVAQKYILAAGTSAFAINGAANTDMFDVVPGAAAALKFANKVLNSNDRTRFSFEGQPITGVNGLAVAAVDKVGNVATGFTGPIQIQLGSGTGGALMGTTTVNAFRGIAIFNQAYIRQDGPTASEYTLQAQSPGTTISTATSNPFTVAIPQTWQGSPQVQFVPPTVADQTSGQSFNITLQVTNGGQPTSDYDKFAHLLVELRDTNGNPLPTGPLLEGDQTKNMPENGSVQFMFTINAPVTQRFTLLALLDLNGQAVLSNAFTVTVPTSPAAGPVPGPSAAGDPPHPIVQVGLGSYTQNFDLIKQSPSWQNITAGKRPYPPSVGFDPAVAQDPQMLQPNVAAGFNQVPVSSKWWSSLIFPRATAGDHARDSQNHQLYPLYADPFAAMVNSNSPDPNDPLSASDFAGLGLSYPDNLFVSQTTQYKSYSPPAIPPGQPPSETDPRFPGANSFEYPYYGNGDPRLYQDFAIGLQGVKADGKVLRYSDSTVTLDWAGRLQATLGEGLPYAYFTAPNANGTTIQLVTSPKADGKDPNVKNPVTITAFDPSGTQTGPLRVEIKYTLHDGRDDPHDPTKTWPTRTVDHFYGIFLPAGVSWRLSGNTNGTLTAQLTSQKNYFSVATLPDKSQFNMFRQRAYSFVTGSASSFTFDQSTGKLITTYSLQTKVMESGGDLIDNHPVQALFVTQYANLSAHDRPLLTNFRYVSARGTMKVWDGPVFHTVLQYQGTLPAVAPLPEDGTSHADLWRHYLLPILQGISTMAQSDGRLVLDQLFADSNNYFDAQSMFGAMQLVPILLEVGQSKDPGLTANDRAQANSYAEQVFNQVKGRMGAWLSAQDDRALQTLYYQPATPLEATAPKNSKGWESLMSILSGFGSSESLNDHQLIAGYFIKTAALLAQYDSTWGDQARRFDNGTKTLPGKLGDIVRLMINDVSDYNRGDTQFPFLRNFDVYAGHSWVDGAANDIVGNNMESSSESLNYASALIQWGEATGVKSMRDLGVYLYTTELEAVQTYWFNVKNTDAFPQAYTTAPDPNNPGKTITVRTLVSKLNGDGGAYVGFIGLETTRLAGIQMLPLNGAAYYLGLDPAFAGQTYDLAIQGGSTQGLIPLAPPYYQSVIYPYLALSDPGQALKNYRKNLNSIGQINPRDLIDNSAFNIHWMEGLQAYGQVDGTVTADTVSYAVFKQPSGGARTFVAYNPDVTPEGVTFKDDQGNVLLALTGTNAVPGRTMVVVKADGTIINRQTTPDFSLRTPSNRFFLTGAQAGGNYTFTNGKAGAGEHAIDVSASGATSDGTPVTFQITGVTGTLGGPDAQAFFSLWLDPQFRSTGAPPGISVSIKYDRFGDGSQVITHQYDQFNLSKLDGFVEYRSPANGGLVGIPGIGILPYFADLKDGTITVTIRVLKGSGDGTTPVRLRTDGAAEQGRVSYLDLPYDLTVVGGKPMSQLDLGGDTLGAAPPVVAAPAPPTGDSALYVRALYREILQRDADPAGLQSWVDLLGAGAARDAVVQGIWQSAEHRGLQVDQLYATYLHRAADPVGRAFWTDALLQGTSEDAVIEGLLTSPEYQQAHADLAGYLTGLYADVLGRAPDGAGLTAWQAAAAQGGLPRATMADDFLQSPEDDQDRVGRDYTSFLGRAADPAGETTWVQDLLSHAMTEDQVAVALLASDEFFARAAAGAL
jgi:hypothetical protein